MSVLVDKNTRLLVQGITGKSGAFHARGCRDYGTNVVAGVTPGAWRRGFRREDPGLRHGFGSAGADRLQRHHDLRAGAWCGGFHPGGGGRRVELIVCITEGIPVMDMMRVKAALATQPGIRLIGPNCPGIITPDQCKIGIMPGYIHKPGNVGVISRSGTLTYEAVWQLTSRGYGQSTCIGIGGDPINGTSHLDAAKLFTEDPGTEAIILIGEIGGTAEEEAAAWLGENCRKPVAAFIAGATAPPGRRMGHAGAIVSGGQGTAEGKMPPWKQPALRWQNRPPRWPTR